MPISKDSLAALEQILDTHSLEEVIQALAEIARAKADHLLSTWQSKNDACLWNEAADMLETTACRSEIINVSY